jgi:hypothetical protein
MPPGFYLFMAIVLVALHLLFNLWVVFGALLTKNRPRLALAHIVSFIYGAIINNVGWPCPLTLAEIWCEVHAGRAAYQGPFLLHYIEVLVYPNFPVWLLGLGAIVACLVNLGVYLRRHIHEQPHPA